MKKTITLLFFLLSFSAIANEPTNLDIHIKKLIQYHDSGNYQKDQYQVITAAKEYLKIRLKQNNKLPLAIVLDIDETSLSNYPDMVAMNFGGTYEQIIVAENKGTDPVIHPTLDLYHFAKANNVAVFFITARTEDARNVTEKNLQAAGFSQWDGLFLKPVDSKQKSAQFKTKAREQIEKLGYQIVINIGDQQSDLRGGHAEKTFKMPNPFYFTS